MAAYVFLSNRNPHNQSKAKPAASISNNIDKNNSHLITMVPAQKQSHCDGYVGHGDTTNYTGNLSLMHLTPWCDYDSKASLGAELMIGDRLTEEESKSCSIDESRSNSKEEDIIRKNTRDDHDDDNRWLQLGLGGHHASENITPDLMHLDRIEPTSRNGTCGLLQLDLSLSAGATTTTKQHLNPLFPTNIRNSNPFILQEQQPKTSFSFHQQEVLTWGSSYRPNSWMNQNIPSSSSSFSSLSPSMLNNYYLQRLMHQHPPVLEDGGPSSSSVSAVVDPPRRPHSGVWIVLEASQNQDIEPFLPQIPKNYLRIKDGTTTVRLLTKYLVSKLRLNSESEIEMRCRGLQLLPFLTLQHVRDCIWISNSRRRRRRSTTTTADDDENAACYYYNASMTLLPHSTSSTATSAEKHLMILNYARCGGDTTTSN